MVGPTTDPNAILAGGSNGQPVYAIPDTPDVNMANYKAQLATFYDSIPAPVGGISPDVAGTSVFSGLAIGAVLLAIVLLKG